MLEKAVIPVGATNPWFPSTVIPMWNTPPEVHCTVGTPLVTMHERDRGLELVMRLSSRMPVNNLLRLAAARAMMTVPSTGDLYEYG